MALVKCRQCKRRFKNEHGLAIHIGHKHSKRVAKPLEPKPPDIRSGHTERDNSPSTESPLPEVERPDCTETRCAECGQSFASERGLMTHRSTHAEIANVERLSEEHRHDSNDEDDEEEEERVMDEGLSDECARWLNKFSKIAENLHQFNLETFDAEYNAFADFLFGANQKLPGPLHPAVKMFRMRRKGKVRLNDAQYAKSSNPQRADTRRRQRCRDKYEYEKAQYEYFNQRRKVARRVLHASSDKAEMCKIPIDQLEQHYRSIFGETNPKILEDYSASIPHESVKVSCEDIDQAIKAIKIDTSPGYDRILARTIRHLPVTGILAKIMEIMLATGAVPSGLRNGKTPLIHKGGDATNVSNWRPITIYSILRRTIERVLDQQLRSQVDLNVNQRGFVNVPGCHVNSTLVQACLKKAKTTKTNLTVVFLDMSKAYDNVGHAHIERCLDSQGISLNLKRLIMALLKNNTIKVDLGMKRSNQIEIKRSVPQGGPLSPMLFNVAIDHVFKEVCDPIFANQYGFKLHQDLDSLSMIGFADDLAVISSSMEGATRIVDLVQTLLNQIGLKVNPGKSKAIHIQNGEMVEDQIKLANGTPISCISRDSRIKYLGCSFADELIFDSTVVGKITDKLNSLIKSPLLKRDQKLNIMNQYVLPMLTFPLQAAPLRKIPARDLEVLDLNIRNSIKAIVGLPVRTSTEMFYAPRKFRGLGVVRCEWEVFLQHFAIAQKLLKVKDVMFHREYNCEEEMRICKEALGVEGDTTRKLRALLRQDAFERWSNQPYQGIGVKHFEAFPKSNKFMMARTSLSSSEWVAAIKLNTNYANLAGVPGVNTEHRSASSIRCRRCGNENETIPHVLGACDFGENLRNERHHSIKRRINTLLQDIGFTCIDEAACTDKNGSCRRIDILAFEPNSDRAYLIDPSVRFETNEDMDAVVQKEKERIYRGCIQDLSRRYQHHGKRKFEVIGLWWGSRGTISKGVVKFFDRFKLNKKLLPEMAESVLVSSIRMLHHHIYST